MKILAAALVGLAFAAPAGLSAAPKLTPAERAAITRSIDVFVNHAVTRHNPAAYDVVAPELRPGMTRKSWAHDDLPVYPFPARGKTHPWNILYVTREEVGLELELHSARREQAGPDHLPHLPPAGRQALARRLVHAGRDLAPLGTGSRRCARSATSRRRRRRRPRSAAAARTS